ncbi:MAG: adenine phosphoribosyltransferase [Bacteroidales bacterium]|nr:adenine phosphoribosyltransferase [Bacteroidales bacterium]MDO4999881.1 adenine phosphoribosyltransferase [Bacteroidales bacterium]
MSIEKLKASLRAIPDFPKKGILFWDVTTMFKDAESLRTLSDELYELYKDKGITKVVGLESRGFVMGPPLAIRLGAGFVMARKPGKLPAEVVSETYVKEYGRDTIEIHTDAITPDDVVLIHDDLLATGGTMAAAVNLVRKFHPKRIYINFNIEIEALKGRDVLPQDIETTSVITV